MSNLKALSSDPRIRGIFQKHLTALSQEIAQELTQPFLAHWGLTNEDFGVPVDGPTTHTPSEPLIPAALLYDSATRRWTCPRCQLFADLRRRSVTAHLRFCKAKPVGVSAPTPSAKPPRRRKSRSTKKKS